MAQKFTIILVDDESYNIIRQVPERIAKDRSLTLRFLLVNHFISPLQSCKDDPQYLVIPEPIYEENIESFYVPEDQPEIDDIPFVARWY